MKLHHIALGADDLERVAAFYTNYFECPELRRHCHDDGTLRSIWLDCAGTILMVEQAQMPARRVEGLGHGPFLLAFTVSPDERTNLEKRLLDAGFDVETRTGFTSYTRDPEGNRVAFSHFSL